MATQVVLTTEGPPTTAMRADMGFGAVRVMGCHMGLEVVSPRESCGSDQQTGIGRQRQRLTAGASGTLVLLAGVFLGLVVQTPDGAGLGYGGGDGELGHGVWRDTVVCPEVAEAVVVSGRRLGDSGDAGCSTVVRVARALEGMVSGGATRAER